MNPRHAATLALVGWYLLAPPMNSWPGLPYLDIKAPLSKWRKQAAFSSAKECEVAREKDEADYARSVKSANPNIPLPIDNGTLCIAADDPRLKSN